MPRLHELARRLSGLADLGEIMTAMRSLAFIETRRLADRARSTRESIAAIELAIGDLATHVRDAVPAVAPRADILVAIGSDRGFCGDFNRIVAEALRPPPATPVTIRIAVGSQLAQRLLEEGIEHEALAGASVVEDVPQVLTDVSARLEAWTAASAQPSTGLRIVHHDHDGRLHDRRILPVPEAPVLPRWRQRPLLQLRPRALYAALADQYVPAVLGGALVASLLAENRRRLDHMNGALQRLRDEIDATRRARNRARREAITQEIEVMLLGAMPPRQA